MATKLKNLTVKKVDFVDAGANPDADIKLFKGKNMGAPPVSDNGNGGIWNRLLGFIGKAAGLNQDEIDTAVEEIQKGGAVSFNERFNQARNSKIADEIWDICYALQSSLCSILNDEDLDNVNASTAMMESLEEFHAVVQECIKQWSNGKISNVVSKKKDITEFEMEVIKSARDRLTETIEKSAVVVEKTIDNEPKGEQEMRIDKSKLTPAEAAFLESIEKRYGTEEGAADGIEMEGPEPSVQAAEPVITKSVVSAPTVAISAVEPAESGTDVYKGLHPAVKAELESLKKYREDAETKELTNIAKKYEIIGKKPEELVPLLKSLKGVGGTSYDDMIAVLDQAVATVEKSGAFSEIGKSGHGSSAAGAVEAKVDTIAKGYMEKDSSLDYTAAVAKAWENHPELMDEYEEEAGF
ncbi:hypothetical protein [Candidatus Merdisoma sp. JLR.KK006]|uniref:hypothetical protein n=1 Tax=Candidatus Merdisoma sp. JLR.KK006 TaxID=3112626 RepID=UPI002FF3AD00